MLDDVAHLAPAEAPGDGGPPAGRRLPEDALGRAWQPASDPDGLDERRRAWPCVARCSATPTSTAPSPATTPFTEDFQQLITEYAWGGVWTRPGLDRRSRSMITLTALIARGHDEELAMHVRAARTNGLSDDEIKEVILHSAIYCGVPAANTAFRIAQLVLQQEPEEDR